MPAMPSIRSIAAKLWTRDSRILLGGFFVTLFLIVYIWWPLAEEYLAYVDWDGAWWLYIDWLLLGIFAFMSLTILAGADLKTDLLIIFVGMCGGLAIESWGTQTSLWFYYTDERPPLWILPAWPIASLSIDRLTRLLLLWVTKSAKAQDARTRSSAGRARFAGLGVRFLYWLTFIYFTLLMLDFVAPTFDTSFTWLAVFLCILLIATPTDHRLAFLTFLAGSGLGYFLEVWGTTRGCWTYYTYESPPLFAVFAHGMAAVAFWRAGLLLKWLGARLGRFLQRQTGISFEA